MEKKLMIVMIVFALIVFGITKEVKVEAEKVFVGITYDYKSDGDCFNILACFFQGIIPYNVANFNSFIPCGLGSQQKLK